MIKFIKIKDTLEAKFKNEYMTLAKVNANLGLCYYQSGDKTKAKYFFDQANKIFIENLGLNNFYTTTIDNFIQNINDNNNDLIKIGYPLIIKP